MGANKKYEGCGGGRRIDQQFQLIKETVYHDDVLKRKVAFAWKPLMLSMIAFKHF